MKKEKYIQDLKEIKDLMNKSSKFISLSGWSGISIGIVALIAAFTTSFFLKVFPFESKGFLCIIVGENKILPENFELKLIIIGVITLSISLILSFIFTYNKSKRLNQKIWTKQTKLLLWNLFIPLAVGGVLCLILLKQGRYGSISSYTLLFYGLALINASKYTLSEIRGLGIINCVLGLIGVYFVRYGLLLWAIGFGVLHIVYGILMMVKNK